MTHIAIENLIRSDREADLDALEVAIEECCDRLVVAVGGEAAATLLLNLLQVNTDVVQGVLEAPHTGDDEMFQVEIISRGKWTPASPVFRTEAEAIAEAEAWKRTHDVRTRIVRV